MFAPFKPSGPGTSDRGGENGTHHRSSELQAYLLLKSGSFVASHFNEQRGGRIDDT